MAAQLVGALSWGMTVDDNKNREYELVTLIETTSPNDGPLTVSLCPGIPTPGSSWAIGNEYDSAAWCRPNMEVSPVVVNEPNTYWTLKQIFSTKPLQSCSDMTIDNPLLQPPKISGSAVKYLREKFTDKDGDPIRNSAKELIRGEPVEVDDARPTVNISFNAPTAELGNFSQILRNPLNDSPLWGMPARCVKFTDWTWEKNFYGLCNAYYTHNLGFELSWDTFDKYTPDIGIFYQVPVPGGTGGETMLVRTRTRDGQPTPMFLDGSGGLLPWDGTPVEILCQPLPESNLLILGIPTSL
jgi:hypothetical protein